MALGGNHLKNLVKNQNIFATRKQAESALAMAQLSILMTQPLFKWEPDWSKSCQVKYTIKNVDGELKILWYRTCKDLLSFETEPKAKLFMDTYSDLIKTYTM